MTVRNEQRPKTTPARLGRRAVRVGMRAYNRLLAMRSRRATSAGELPDLDAITRRSLVRNGMSDHLLPLFLETLSVRPKLIVELGVRGGDSTFVFERVGRMCGSTIVSVDIEDCSRVSEYPDWVFVKSDDVAFARRFPEWCEAQRLPAAIDVLFLDTSHVFEHTREEIAVWFPLLSPRAKVFFHDTNLRPIYRRKDGSVGQAWDNKRGVIRAVEDYFGKSFDERRDFVDFSRGWLIKHTARCLGFTILERWGDEGWPGRTAGARESGASMVGSTRQ